MKTCNKSNFSQVFGTEIYTLKNDACLVVYFKNSNNHVFVQIYFLEGYMCEILFYFSFKYSRWYLATYQVCYYTFSSSSLYQSIQAQSNLKVTSKAIKIPLFINQFLELPNQRMIAFLSNDLLLK